MSEPVLQLFKVWHFLFMKEYQINSYYGSSQLEIFKKNLEEINEHNSNLSFSLKLGLNQYSDLTMDEFQREYLKAINFKINPGREIFNSKGYYEIRSYYSANDTKLEWKPIDFRQKCGKVRGQGRCCSCYAFSMINTIECNYAIKTGIQKDLSRQQIVDCNPFTGGCDGGNPAQVAVYAHARGIMDETDYPYIGKKQNCTYNSKKAGIYVDGLEKQASDQIGKIMHNSYNMYGLLTRGALSVCLDGIVLKTYKSGIIDLNGCQEVNHAVMIVGFGIDDTTKTSYWIIKNSWNTSWGEQGYARVKVKDDANGNCFINNFVIRSFIS